MPVLSHKCFSRIRACNDIYEICKIHSSSKYDPNYYFGSGEFTLELKDASIKYSCVNYVDLLISIPRKMIMINDKMGLDIEITKDVMTILALLSGYDGSIKKFRKLDALYGYFTVFAPEETKPIIIVSEIDKRYFAIVAPKLV